MTKKLNAIGAKLRPRIRVRTQPAQSPDVNICDLAFFRALACLVRKRRRIASGESRSALFDLDTLAADTRAAFRDYSPETLEEMWCYKSLVMERILACGGGNDYSRRRTAEERTKGPEPGTGGAVSY